MEQLKIEQSAEEGRTINHWTHRPVGICVWINYEMEREGKMKWQNKGVTVPFSGGWYFALHHRQTFDRDMDGVVRWTESIPGGTAVFSCIWFRHVHNTQGLLVVQEGCAPGWEIPAHFGPGDFRGGPGLKKEKRWWWYLSRWPLEAFRTEIMDSFTYSPSAMHSISSTCPLNTILELEGPDGMRKVGFLSSSGSSVVPHTHKQKSSASVHNTVRIQPGLSHPPILALQCLATKPFH